MDFLFSPTSNDAQQALATHIRLVRKEKKWSRDKLAEMSGVPSSTIKRFETTSEISLRQFLLLWETLSDIQVLIDLLRSEEHKLFMPKTTEEVLAYPERHEYRGQFPI